MDLRLAILCATISSLVLGGLILLFAILSAPALADPEIGTRGLQYIILPVGTVYFICIVIVGNIGFPGLYAAQERKVKWQKARGLLGHDRGSLEGCDSCSFVLASLTSILFCPGHDCLLIGKSTSPILFN